MRKKYLVFMVVGLLLITIGGTALAASNIEKQDPVGSSDEFYRQMFEACHGPNGYMTKYFEKNGGVPQSFDWMMGY